MAFQNNFQLVHQSLIQYVIQGSMSKRDIQVFFSIYRKCYVPRPVNAGGAYFKPTVISRSDLANETGIHPTNIRKFVRALEDHGLIKVALKPDPRRESRTINEYVVILHEADLALGAKRASGVERASGYEADLAPNPEAVLAPNPEAEKASCKPLNPALEAAHEKRLYSLILFKYSLIAPVRKYIEATIKYEGKATRIAEGVLRLQKKYGFETLLKAIRATSSNFLFDEILQPAGLVTYLLRKIESQRANFEREIVEEAQSRARIFREVYDTFKNYIDSENDIYAAPELTPRQNDALLEVSGGLAGVWETYRLSAHTINDENFVTTLNQLRNAHFCECFGVDSI